MIGQVLGHYRIVAKIGEGGMGFVYRAYDEVLHRDVAVKVVNKDARLDASASQSLLHEARASSSLAHPNICTIHEVGETDGELYIVMELVEGKSLRAMTGDAGLPPESVLRYGVQIASALARAHDRGIVHRDLKTANIVITADGLVKVLDFGLAKQVGSGIFEGTTRSFTTLQDASNVSGTLPYMAPEILRGDTADYRSDLWALGVVLYEAASGRMPFEGRTGFAIVSSDAGPDQSAPRTTVLHSVRHAHVKKGDFLLLVGTTKGAFILRSNAQRSRWDVGGPYFHGHNVYAMAYDDRGGQHRIWASTQNYWGTLLRSSDDFGKSWTNPQQAPIRFPSDTGVSLKNIWQITLGRPEEPNVLYCGVEPAALFETRDAGETWSLVRGLFDHPHRPRWMPGNGGLALHSVVLDPADKQRMYVAISAGGVYRTNDGGSNWSAQNRGIRAMFMPDKYPEFGQCVHKIAIHPGRPERLFLQNHWGLYRSDNCAESWTDIANGVPSDFGFTVLVHPRNPDCVYVVPVESDEFRCACDGRLRVYRTRNGGASWEPLVRGLPQKRAYETVLRDAMTADSFDPVGIYFGTRSGQLFGSRDEGRTWQKILDGLPSVVCVRNAVFEGASGLWPTSHKAASAPKSRSRFPSTRQSRPTNRSRPTKKR